MAKLEERAECGGLSDEEYKEIGAELRSIGRELDVGELKRELEKEIIELPKDYLKILLAGARGLERGPKDAPGRRWN